MYVSTICYVLYVSLSVGKVVFLVVLYFLMAIHFSLFYITPKTTLYYLIHNILYIFRNPQNLFHIKKTATPAMITAMATTFFQLILSLKKSHESNGTNK